MRPFDKSFLFFLMSVLAAVVPAFAHGEEHTDDSLSATRRELAVPGPARPAGHPAHPAADPLAGIPAAQRILITTANTEEARLKGLSPADFTSDAYRFAKRSTSQGGLGYSDAQATGFANWAARLPAAKKASILALYKLANLIALRSVGRGGLGLTKEQARLIAEEVSQNPEGARHLAALHAALTYAMVSATGPRLSSTEARALAIQLLSRPDAFQAVSVHQTAYLNALSRGLSPAQAMEYANHQAGLSR